MPYSAPPPGRWKWFAAAAVSAFMIPAILIANPLAFLLLLFLYCFPAIIWYLLGRRIFGPRYLYAVLPHSTRKFKKRFVPWRRHIQTDVKYFLSRPAGIRVTFRVATVFLGALGISALLLPFLVPAYSQSGVTNYIFTENVYVTLVFLMLAAMAGLPFILFPAWIYEDVGLRHYAPEEDTIGVPGSALKDFVAGFGILLSVIGMLPLFQNDPSIGGDFALTLLVSGIMALPFALTATVMFVFVVEPMIMAKLERSGAFKEMVEESVVFSPGSNPL